MARGEQALLNRFYPVDLHGDTAVLKPRGDAAGFSLHSVISELDQVRGLIETGRIRNLLIDLGHHRYFGSMVIGDLIDLAQLVRDRGGRAGLCGISDDMASVMRLMQLNEHWEQFPSAAAGLHALAKISRTERAWQSRYQIACAAVVLVAVTVYWFYPRPNYAVVYHEKMQKLWTEVSAKRARSGIDEWHWTAKKTEAQLEPIVAKLERQLKHHRATASEKYLLLAVKFHWLPWLKETGADAEKNGQLTKYYLDMTDSVLAGTPAPIAPTIAGTQAATPAIELASDISGDISTSSGSGTAAEISILPVSGPTEVKPINAPPENDGSQSTESTPI